MTYKDFYEEWLDPDRDYVSAHTSGSTGVPKPVHLSKKDMLASARATVKFFDIRQGDQLATPLSADYIAGKMMAVRAMESGAHLIVEPPSRHPLSSCSQLDRVKLIAIVPQQIDGLLASGVKVDNVIVGGAATSPDAEARALEAWPATAWWATYGMTETCSHVALRRFGYQEYHALPGVEFSQTIDGRLVISSEGVSWSPVVTNDIVKLSGPTSFHFLGRADNAIISGGIKIHPEEVEKLIAPALGKNKFYISSKKSELWGAEPVLVVEGTPPPDGGKRILEHTASLAGSIKRPRSIVWLPSFPLTSSGKIIRRAF
ncbi:MAG: AMP-binding protein [Bacteroides sp.]|nr:AMP-binding protein [Bacteroides sp.]